MTRFLRRPPSARSGWTAFPARRSATLNRTLAAAIAFSLAFVFAWENIYTDQLLSDLMTKKNEVENLRAQVAETRAVIQKRMMLALAEDQVPQVGLRAPDLEQIVLLSEDIGLLAAQPYPASRLSSLEQVQRRVFDFFVTTALARAERPEKP